MRITKKMLEAKIDSLNTITGSPVSYFQSTDPDNRKTSIGHFTLDQAYGGYSLERVCNEGGGVDDRHCYGRHTARELHGLLTAMIDGYCLAKESN